MLKIGGHFNVPNFQLAISFIYCNSFHLTTFCSLVFEHLLPNIYVHRTLLLSILCRMNSHSVLTVFIFCQSLFFKGFHYLIFSINYKLILVLKLSHAGLKLFLKKQTIFSPSPLEMPLYDKRFDSLR